MRPAEARQGAHLGGHVLPGLLNTLSNTFVVSLFSFLDLANLVPRFVIPLVVRLLPKTNPFAIRTG
jgi:hypothetical protein